LPAIARHGGKMGLTLAVDNRARWDKSAAK
jgi:hypothetical protein